MYCVKCGVRLQDGVGECPLCHTAVWMPEETPASRFFAVCEKARILLLFFSAGGVIL